MRLIEAEKRAKRAQRKKENGEEQCEGGEADQAPAEDPGKQKPAQDAEAPASQGSRALTAASENNKDAPAKD